MKNIRLITGALLAMFVLGGCNGGEAIVKNQEGQHPATEASSPYAETVIEYTPAPGQFINNPRMGFAGDETTAQAAAAYAAGRLEKGSEVSLGGFGGYIVVRFDHSVQATGSGPGGYDFSITGNQFGGSSEPGIVWVKQDLNGNGLPDDGEPWYELKGSEYGKEGEKRSYTITYCRPGEDGDIHWTAGDKEGNTENGIIPYAKTDFAPQESFYPAWIAGESYTLTGTLLPRRDGVKDNGDYTTGDYGWGYADNFGEDMLPGHGKKTFFSLSNAVDSAGNSVELKYFDFIKVQTGVNIVGKGGVGELSTEVCRFTDENFRK